MALPRLIEFIESLQKPGGGFIAEEVTGMVQFTDFLPGVTADITITPPAGQYAYFGYRLFFSQQIVPNAFRTTFQWYGHTAQTGNITDIHLREGIEAFIVITRAAPLYISATNISGLVQHATILYFAAMVRTQEEYLLVLQALDELQHHRALPQIPLPAS